MASLMAEEPNSLSTFDQSDWPWWLRLLNWAGTTLRRGGLPLADLTEESLLSAAQRRTRLSDWGNESFRIPLRILLESLEKEANLNFVGRSLLRQYCIHLLVNRLRLQEDFKRHPEILQVPIQRPLFILGLPRTGTTLLHNLLSQDPSSRWLHLWELNSPSPPPEPETHETDPRIEAAKKVVNRLKFLAPKHSAAFSAVHYLNPEGPEECNQLFEHEFASILFELRANVATYSAWLETQDMVTPYRFYRQQLQLLGWHWSGDHWVLKAPAHLLLNLDALLAVFPDACIVQTHRDPLKILPSACSLYAMSRGIYTDRVDLRAISEHVLNRLANGLERGMQVRESALAEQFYDVNYSTLVQDPIGTVRQLYEYFGYKFSPRMEENLNRWISENPQHKHGIHRYSLEQFGLEPEVVNRRFVNYRQRFNISAE
jgi:hypothetical protein